MPPDSPDNQNKRLKIGNDFVDEHSLPMDEIPDIRYYVDYCTTANKSLYQRVLHLDRQYSIPPPPNVEELIVLHMKGQWQWGLCLETSRRLPPLSHGSRFTSLHTDKVELEINVKF